MKEVVDDIIKINEMHKNFWSNARGWAPDNSAELLATAQLDWQISLAHCLKKWINHSNLSSGELILAWANLGALVEGTLKLFYCVYLNDYLKHPNKKRNERIITPDKLTFEPLKILSSKHANFDETTISFLNNIQKHRNIIHAFQARPSNSIGTTDDLFDSIYNYLLFLKEIDVRLPYPD